MYSLRLSYVTEYKGDDAELVRLLTGDWTSIC